MDQTVELSGEKWVLVGKACASANGTTTQTDATLYPYHISTYATRKTSRRIAVCRKHPANPEAIQQLAAIVLENAARESQTRANYAREQRIRDAAPDLLAAAQRVAHIPCEREGNIHCSMLPPDSTLKPCPWCAIRAAIAKAEEAKQ